MKWLIVCIPIIIYFMFVSKSAVIVTDRYIFPIYAVVFGIFWSLVYVFFKKLFEEKYVYLVMCLIGAVFIINGFANANWDYLFRGSEDFLDKAKEHSDENCICIYDKTGTGKILPSYSEINNYKSVTFISQENINSILQHRDLLNDSFILNIIGGNDEKIIDTILEGAPYLNQYEKIGGYAYSTTYWISSTEEIPKVQIYNYDKSSVIGADGNSIGSNVLLTQREQNVWLLTKDEDYVVIELGGLVLDVAGGQYAEGTNIQLFAANGTDAQCWKMIENRDGSYSLLAKDERFALTCASNGNIYLAEYCEGEKLQKWWVLKPN